MIAREEADRRRAAMRADYAGGMSITAVARKYEISWGHANCVLRPERHAGYVRKREQREREREAAA